MSVTVNAHHRTRKGHQGTAASPRPSWGSIPPLPPALPAAAFNHRPGKSSPWLNSGPMERTWQGPGGVFCSRHRALGKPGCVGPVPAALANPCLTPQDVVTCACLNPGVHKAYPHQTDSVHTFNAPETWGGGGTVPRRRTRAAPWGGGTVHLVDGVGPVLGFQAES